MEYVLILSLEAYLDQLLLFSTNHTVFLWEQPFEAVIVGLYAYLDVATLIQKAF